MVQNLVLAFLYYEKKPEDLLLLTKINKKHALSTRVHAFGYSQKLLFHLYLPFFFLFFYIQNSPKFLLFSLENIITYMQINNLF